MTRTPPVLLAALLLWSCAAPSPPPPPPPPPATPTPPPLPTPAPQADVWDAPHEVLTREGYEVTDENREGGVLVARLAKATRTAAEQKQGFAFLRRIAHVDDPRVGGAAQRMTGYEILVRVKIGSGESAEVSMAVKAEFKVFERAREKGGSGEVSYRVPSRGVLEKELLEKIGKSLEE